MRLQRSTAFRALLAIGVGAAATAPVATVVAGDLAAPYRVRTQGDSTPRTLAQAATPGRETPVQRDGPLICGPQARPAFFERNRGQAPDGWDFLARCRGYVAFVRSGETMFSFGGAGLRMTLEGARDREPDVRSMELEGRANYFLGNDPSRWRTGVPLTSGALYRDAAPGTTWRVGHKDRMFDFELTVPGTDEPRVALQGWTALRIGEDGALSVEMPGGVATFSAPRAWQQAAGAPRPVDAGFTLDGDGVVRIALGPRDPARRTRIDPTVSWSSYVGASLKDSVMGAAIDAAGACFVAGATYSSNFPATSGSWDSSKYVDAGSVTYSDAWVAKVAANGTSFAWCTFLGGAGEDAATTLMLDSAGAPVVGGRASGSTWPTTSGVVYATKPASGSIGVVTKLAPDGASITWSTYLADNVPAYAIGPSGAVHFLAAIHARKLASDGSAITWSNQILPSGTNGTEYSRLMAITVGPSGETYVVGDTDQQNLSLTAGTLRTSLAGRRDGLVAKIAADGTTAWRTLLAGTRDDYPRGVGCDASGRPAIVGRTDSTDFPVSADAAQPNRAGTNISEYDAFFSRLDASGVQLRYSTFLGGAGDDVFSQLAVHPLGHALAVGTTGTTTFPMSSPFQSSSAGGGDLVMTKFDHRGAVVWSSYCGGSSADSGNALAMGADGTLLAGGVTLSTDFPPVSAFQSAFGGLEDGWFVRIPDTLPTTASLPSVAATQPVTATAGFPCTIALETASGTDPIAWTRTTGSPPAGLTMSSSGVVTGTPLAAGNSTFGVFLADDWLLEGTGNVTLRVVPPPSLPAAALPQWTAGQESADQLAVTNGTGPFTWSVSDGALPEGLSMDATGRVAGTPDAPGTASFTARVEDRWGAVATRAMTVKVNVPPSLAGTLPDTTTGQSYDSRMIVSGGTAPFTWAVTGGTPPVPGGISAATGAVTGVASAPGTYDLVVGVTDARGATATRAARVIIHEVPQILTTELPFAAVGRTYSAAPVVQGGTPPYAWNLDGGEIPAPCTFDPATGRVSGVPASASAGLLRLAVTDAAQASATRTISLEVAGIADLTKWKSSSTVVVTPTASARTTRYFEVLRGCTLDVSVSGGGTKTGGPSVRIFAPDGSEPDLTAFFTSTPKGARVKKWPVPATGRYLVAIEPAAGFRGKMKFTISLTPPTKLTGVVAVGGEADGIVTFTAPPGARLSIAVKPALGSASAPAFTSLTGPGGADLLSGGTQKRKGATISFTSKVPLEGGDHAVQLGSPAAGDVVWTVTLKRPKRFEFDLAEVPAGDE